MENVKFLIAGDKALLVQMGDEISMEVNRKVLMLRKALLDEPVEASPLLADQFSRMWV